MESIVYVIPDGFANFAENAGVVSVSELHKLVAQGAARTHAEKYVVCPGVNPDCLEALQQEIETSRVPVELAHAVGEGKLEGDFVHKRHSENVLISRPQAISASRFHCWLLPDERCAEMTDHVTGQHVPGAVLFEAARQMMMATIECHLQAHRAGRLAYVMNELTLKYRQFVFPLSTSMRLDVLASELTSSDVFQFTMSVDYVQNESVGCTVQCTAAAYPCDMLKKLESRKAKGAVRQAVRDPRSSAAGSPVERDEARAQFASPLLQQGEP